MRSGQEGKGQRAKSQPCRSGRAARKSRGFSTILVFALCPLAFDFCPFFPDSLLEAIRELQDAIRTGGQRTKGKDSAVSVGASRPEIPRILDHSGLCPLPFGL